MAYPVLGETFSADISQYFRNFVLLVGPKKYWAPKIILNILLKIKYKIPNSPNIVFITWVFLLELKILIPTIDLEIIDEMNYR